MITVRGFGLILMLAAVFVMALTWKLGIADRSLLGVCLLCLLIGGLTVLGTLRFPTK